MIKLSPLGNSSTLCGKKHCAKCLWHMEYAKMGCKKEIKIWNQCIKVCSQENETSYIGKDSIGLSFRL